MPPSLLNRLRKICLALPQAHEVEAWGEPTFRVKNKLFAMHAAAGNHHGQGREAVWLKAAKGNQELMIRDAPNRFFSPPYVGPSGWIGVWLDAKTDWEELAELVGDAYRLTAPKRLLTEREQNKGSLSRTPVGATKRTAVKKGTPKSAGKRPKSTKARHR